MRTTMKNKSIVMTGFCAAGLLLLAANIQAATVGGTTNAVSGHIDYDFQNERSASLQIQLMD